MSSTFGVYSASGPSSKVSTTYFVGSGVGLGVTAAGAAARGVGVTGLAGDFAAATTTEPITALTSIITARPTALFPARVKRTSMFPPGRWVVTSSPVQPCVNHPRKPAPTPLPYQQFTDTGRFA